MAGVVGDDEVAEDAEDLADVARQGENVERAAVLGDAEPLHEVVLGRVPEEGIADRRVGRLGVVGRRGGRSLDGVVVDLVDDRADGVEPGVVRRGGAGSLRVIAREIAEVVATRLSMPPPVCAFRVGPVGRCILVAENLGGEPLEFRRDRPWSACIAVDHRGEQSPDVALGGSAVDAVSRSFRNGSRSYGRPRTSAPASLRPTPWSADEPHRQPVGVMRVGQLGQIAVFEDVLIVAKRGSANRLVRARGTNRRG